MIRILVVDDSPTARGALCGILESDPEMEVVGQAKDGREGVEMAKRLRPDLVTMDLQMPRMDGFQATEEIMIEAPTPIVIVSASTRIQEVETAMQALRAGALTLLLKPPGPTSPDFEKARQEILSAVKAMADVKVIRRYRRKQDVSTATETPAPAAPASAAEAAPPASVRAVAVTASTGGPPALNALLGELPEDFPAPILLVQHMAAGFIEGFVSWLDSVVALRVKLASHHEPTVGGVVYVAPQNRHLGVTREGRIRLSDEPPISGFRPAGTHLFDAVAKHFGEDSIAVILTGMGRDGVDGMRAIHQAGGRTMVQDEESCVVFGMPKAAIDEGLVDVVSPLPKMARQLMRWTAKTM